MVPEGTGVCVSNQSIDPHNSDEYGMGLQTGPSGLSGAGLGSNVGNVQASGVSPSGGGAGCAGAGWLVTQAEVNAAKKAHNAKCPMFMIQFPLAYTNPTV
ncbi:MAG: hypothetical protein ACREA0_34525 [bacterium]